MSCWAAPNGIGRLAVCLARRAALAREQGGGTWRVRERWLRSNCAGSRSSRSSRPSPLPSRPLPRLVSHSFYTRWQRSISHPLRIRARMRRG
jgi:hypothetical protein